MLKKNADSKTKYMLDYKNSTSDVMGVTFVTPEPGGHFCNAKQLIEGDGKFQISR